MPVTVVIQLCVQPVSTDHAPQPAPARPSQSDALSYTRFRGRDNRHEALSQCPSLRRTVTHEVRGRDNHEYYLYYTR